MAPQTTIFLKVFFLILSASLNSQCLVQGKVIDAISQEPIPFCTITLSDENGNQIKGTETDFDGNYFINEIESGQYTIQTIFLGMKPCRKKLTLVDAEVHYQNFCLIEGDDLGDIFYSAPNQYIPLIEHDAFTKCKAIYPNKRKPGKTYYLFKEKRSASISGLIIGEDGCADNLSGEVSLYKRGELVDSKKLSNGLGFQFKTLNRGKYLLEIKVEGYDLVKRKLRLKRATPEKLLIELENI